MIAITTEGFPLRMDYFLPHFFSFICHIKHWARRCNVFVSSCSALAVTFISPILACTLMETVYTKTSSLILVFHSLLQLLICCKCWSVAIFNIDCCSNLGYLFFAYFSLDVPILT